MLNEIETTGEFPTYANSTLFKLSEFLQPKELFWAPDIHSAPSNPVSNVSSSFARRNFSLAVCYSLKFTRCSWQNLLVTCCRSRSLQKIRSQKNQSCFKSTYYADKFKTSNGDAKDSHQRCLHLNKITRKMKSNIFDKLSLIICKGTH